MMNNFSDAPGIVGWPLTEPDIVEWCDSGEQLLMNRIEPVDNLVQ
jgi:hypothetical protein